MYTDDAEIGITTAYTQPSWNFRNIYLQGFGAFYLLTWPLTNNTSLALPHSSQGASYLRFGIAMGSHANLTTSASGTLPSTFAMTIVRTK